MIPITVMADRVTQEATRRGDPSAAQGQDVLRAFARLITSGKAQLYNSDYTSFDELLLGDPILVEALFITRKFRAGQAPSSCLTTLGSPPTIHDFLLIAGTVRNVVNTLAGADLPPLDGQYVPAGSIAALLVVSHNNDEAGTIMVASPDLTFLQVISTIHDAWQEHAPNWYQRLVRHQESVH